MNVVTGNVWLDHTDAAVPGVGDELVFRRSYNSINAFKIRGGAFGPGWHHSFERTVTAAPAGSIPGLIVRGANGVLLFFEDRDQDLTYRPLVPATEESWIVARPTDPVPYTRYFRKGGSEEYDLNGRLAAVEDRWANRTVLGWNGALLATITDEGGRALSLGYEGNVLRTLSGPSGLIASYEYQNGILSRVTYADEQQSGYSFSYWTDPSGGGRLLQQVGDLEGKTLEFHEYYSGTGQGKTSELGGGQEKLTFEYRVPDGQFPPEGYRSTTKVIDARGNVTWYRYREVAGMRRVVNTEGQCPGCGGGGQQVQQWAYDENGHVNSHTDGEGNVTTYTYDPATGDLLSESRKPDPNASTSLTTTFTYHPDGRMHTRTDPRNGQTTWTYAPDGTDEKQTITQTITSTRNRETTVWHNSDGKPRRIRDPLDHDSFLFYKPEGDLDYIVDPAGKETHFTYDAMGRRTQVTNPPTNPAALEPRYEYDKRGQVLKIIDPTDSSKFTQFTYDKGSRRTEVRDALQRNTNRRTEYGYDAYGRLQFVTRWLTSMPNQTTEFHYDVMSNLEWIKDARGKQTTFEYDGYSRVKKVFYPSDTPDPRVEEFTYDGAGRLETRKDRRGITTTYSYDGLGRLTGKSYAGGTVATAPVTFAYDGTGNLTLADDGSTTLGWTHNLTGEPASTTQSQLVGGLTMVTSLAYGYDDAGNRTSLDTGAGFSLGYDYDLVGRPWHIVRGSNTFTFGYDDASRRRSLTYPNGVVANLTPDSLSRLEALEVIRGATNLNRFDYTYDDVGNRTSKTTPAVSEDYRYDEVYQLDTVHRNSTLAEDFGHDPVGNRNSTLALPDPSQWVYSSRNELLTMGSASFTYDLNGNLTSTGASTYEWDAENRLTRVTRNGAEVARYRYDPLGRRVEKLAGGVRTTYVYDGEDILRERVGNSNRYFVHGPGIDEPLAKVAGTTVTYLHADGLGSIVSHTNAAGSAVYSRSYDAFGNLETGSAEPGYAFTGREWDPETGLHYYRARYYDARLGRFISEDPIGFMGGINFYAYVTNGPTGRTDPLGLDGGSGMQNIFAPPGICGLLQGQTLGSAGNVMDPKDPTSRGCVGLTLKFSCDPTAQWPEDKARCGYDTLQDAFSRKCANGGDPFVFAHQYNDPSTRHMTGQFNYVAFGARCNRCFYAEQGGWNARVIASDCSSLPDDYATTTWCRQCCGE